MRILIVEDDEEIVSFLKRGLEEEGFFVDVAFEGEEGEYLAKNFLFDIIILDWMLPKKSGIEIVKSLREAKTSTPILMLTAKDSIKDKVDGLKGGADDYLTKPFSFDELIARVEALYRRDVARGSNLIEFNDISINLDSKEIKKGNTTLRLTLKEYELLLLLIKNKNKIVSKRVIEETIWKDKEYLDSNVVEVAIYNLRKKVGKEYIKSLRGVGYKFEF